MGNDGTESERIGKNRKGSERMEKNGKEWEEVVTQRPVQNQVQHCVKLHHRQVADVGQAVDPEQLRSHILHCTSESDTRTVRYWTTRKCPTRARGTSSCRRLSGHQYVTVRVSDSDMCSLCIPETVSALVLCWTSESSAQDAILRRMKDTLLLNESFTNLVRSAKLSFNRGISFILRRIASLL